MKYLILLSLLITTAVMAEGDKNSSWQTIDEKVCSVFIPSDLDDACYVNPEEHSGQAVLCVLKVTCVGDDD